MNVHKTFNLIIAFVFVFSLLGMPAPALAQEPNPTFAAHLPDNQVHAYNWIAGSTLTLTIDDPAISGSPDFQGTEIVPDNDLYGNTWTVFELPNFKLKPGQTMTITDNVTTKTHVIRTVAVVSVNPGTDVITGTAQPNTEVGINAHYNPGGDYVHRNIFTDANGDWMVNLSMPGPNPGEERTYDIVTGSWGTAFQWDEDNDSTFYAWRVLDPSFMLNVNNDSSWRGLDAWNWPLGSQVTLTVDNPNTSQNPDYSEVQTMVPGNDEWHLTHAMYMQDNNFEGHPGFTIILSDGVQTKTMIVPLLAVTGYDLANDTITGVSDPFMPVTVACAEGVEPTVTADSEGNWLVNFRDPENPDEVIYDIKPGVACEPQIHHEFTIVLRDWRVPIDTTPPTITWLGNIHDGDSFYFGFVPPEPTCTASDDLSGVDGACSVTGYASTVGTHTLTATARDNTGNLAIETRSYTILAWTLKGFYQPVDMNGVYNIAKNGGTVPFKFEIFAGPNELTDTTYFKGFTYAQTYCEANAPTDIIETTVTGDTSLNYDATAGQFVYIWKTPRTAGRCYRVTMSTIDGSSLVAYFKLK